VKIKKLSKRFLIMHKLSDKEIRENILEVSNLMYQKGMVNAYEGNVSYNDEGRIYITPSQVCKGYLKSEMIIVTDISGNILEAESGYAPSSELKMHLECYRLREETKAVVHSHSPYATAHALANKPISSKAYPEMIVIFNEIPLVKYGRPSTEEIYAGFADVINNDFDVFLIANHGIISMGDDLFDAFFKNEAAENTARILTITELIGGEKALSAKELEALHMMRKEHRKR